MINVKHTVAENDALSLDVRRVLERRAINVEHTVAENDAPIVLRGLILGLDQRIMMDTVQHVSSNSFLMM